MLKRTKENWVNDNKATFSKDLVKEFMVEYNVKTEDEAREGLAEYYYFNMYEINEVKKQSLSILNGHFN